MSRPTAPPTCEALAAELVRTKATRRSALLVRRSFADRDAAYVKLLASRLAATAPQTAALLVSTQQEPALVVGVPVRQ